MQGTGGNDQNFAGKYMVVLVVHSGIIPIFHRHNNFQRIVPVRLETCIDVIVPDADGVLAMIFYEFLYGLHSPRTGKITIYAVIKFILLFIWHSSILFLEYFSTKFVKSKWDRTRGDYG